MDNVRNNGPENGQPQLNRSHRATPMQLRNPATTQVQPLDAPPKIERVKGTHPRRLLPYVREGQERPRHSQTWRAVIAALDAPAPEIKIALNTPLTGAAQAGTSSNVGEPSCSINGDIVFYTGNWYAAFSVDGGRTFKYLDPNQMAKPGDPAGVTFCCDQVVNFIPSIDTFVWLLQYGPREGDNIQRIAFAKTADVQAGRWRTFDVTTAALELPGYFLDFPDLAVGANFLYMTTNCFAPDANTVGSAVVRIPIESIQAGNPTAEKFVSLDFFSFRVVQNCGDVAYFAAHKDTSTLEVFNWPEGAASPTSQEVPVARWMGTNGYFSRTPDGRRWLDRADPRITGATLANGELWFSWGVDAGSNQRTKPFVQMARIGTRDMALIDNVNLFDSDNAICYAGLATNSKGEIGVSYAIGGSKFPSHAVGIINVDQGSTITSLIAGAGQHGPMPNSTGHGEWGDFLTARPAFGHGELFAAAGYCFVNAGDQGDSDATPRFVLFGRSSAAAGGSPGAGGGAIGGTPPDPGADGGDGGGGSGGDGGAPSGGSAAAGGHGGFDVNAMPTVTPAVAAKIKAACGINTAVRAAAQPPRLLPQMVTKPGSERWPVKTGQDDGRDLVGKNMINGKSLGAGIVETTVEELISMPRPVGLEDIMADPPAFKSKRVGPVETTIWRMNVRITVLKQETDGDYHLVLQGASGETMVGEIPTPTTDFIGKNNPWTANIKEARRAIDDKLVHPLHANDFVLDPATRKLVPRDSFSPESLPAAATAMAEFKLPESFRTPEEGEAIAMPAFKTAIPSTPAKITGVGFFDRMHGQTGVAPNVIELHPILKIEWL